MSVDFVVFDPAGAPRNGKAFREWYSAAAEWTKGEDNFDPKLSSPLLQQWYQGMIEAFPDLMLADEDSETDEHGAEYSFERHIVQVGMSPRFADAALKRSDALAAELQLGTYYPMDDDGRSNKCIRFPDGPLDPDPPAQSHRGLLGRLFGSKK